MLKHYFIKKKLMSFSNSFFKFHDNARIKKKTQYTFLFKTSDCICDSIQVLETLSFSLVFSGSRGEQISCYVPILLVYNPVIIKKHVKG